MVSSSSSQQWLVWIYLGCTTMRHNGPTTHFCAYWLMQPQINLTLLLVIKLSIFAVYDDTGCDKNTKRKNYLPMTTTSKIGALWSDDRPCTTGHYKQQLFQRLKWQGQQSEQHWKKQQQLKAATRRARKIGFLCSCQRRWGRTPAGSIPSSRRHNLSIPIPAQASILQLEVLLSTKQL